VQRISVRVKRAWKSDNVTLRENVLSQRGSVRYQLTQRRRGHLVMMEIVEPRMMCVKMVIVSEFP